MLFGPILVGDHLYKVDTYLCVSFQSTFSGDRWRICILFDFLYYIFFSLKDQFLILLRSAAAAQKILEAQVFFEQYYYS